jgi:predicted  nucleic acid-binding Zn-ribbon protein
MAQPVPHHLHCRSGIYGVRFEQCGQSKMTHFCGQCGRAIQNGSKYAFWLCIDCAKERFPDKQIEEREERLMTMLNSRDYYMSGWNEPFLCHLTAVLPPTLLKRGYYIEFCPHSGPEGSTEECRPCIEQRKINESGVVTVCVGSEDGVVTFEAVAETNPPEHRDTV